MTLRPTTLALGCVFSVLLAGCADVVGDAPSSQPATPADCPRPDREAAGEDWSNETLAFTVGSAGAFQLDVPVPLSPDGSDVDDWLGRLAVPTGWIVERVTTDAGPALRIDGSGDGVVHACSIQAQAARGNGCCAEQYLDARWSTSTQQRGEEVRVWLASGLVSLAIDYTASSNWCGASASYQSSSLRPGWNTVPGEHPAWCE